jgi:hypothetical protein
MNHSFRTAFWAMCLGLTVPMLLFIGAELVSGNQHAPLLSHGNRFSSGQKSADESQERAELLRADPAGNAKPRPMSDGDRVAAAPASMRSRAPQSAEAPHEAAAEQTSPAQLQTIEPELAEMSLPPWSSRPENVPHRTARRERLPVRLGPQLEAEAGVPGINVGLETGMSDRSPFGALPRSAAEGPIHRDPAAAQIDERLTRIQQHLDQLTHTLLMQTQQKQQEQLQQSTQLMQQIQQAGRLQELERQLARLQETAAAMNEPAAAGTKRASPGPRAAQPPAAQSTRATSTKIYYPRHLSADELLTHIIPWLTHGTGRANAAGAPLPPAEIARSGRNAAINPPRVIVTDAPEVHVEIERIMRELDVPPANILLDARVYAVTSGPEMPQGFDFANLMQNDRPWLSSNGEPTGSPMILAILNGAPDEFIRDVERSAALRTVAAPRATVPERLSADLVIGAPPRPAESANGPQPLPAASPGATRLRIRPFRTAGGIRLEISHIPIAGPHSAGTAESAPAAVAQIFVPHGQTVVVAGLGESADTEPHDGAATTRERTDYFVLLTPSATATEKP